MVPPEATVASPRTVRLTPSARPGLCSSTPETTSVSNESVAPKLPSATNDTPAATFSTCSDGLLPRSSVPWLSNTPPATLLASNTSSCRVLLFTSVPPDTESVPGANVRSASTCNVPPLSVVIPVITAGPPVTNVAPPVTTRSVVDSTPPSTYSAPPLTVTRSKPPSSVGSGEPAVVVPPSMISSPSDPGSSMSCRNTVPAPAPLLPLNACSDVPATRSV